MEIINVSVIKCPVCGFSAAEQMPSDRCVFLYRCDGCGAILRPKAGDCCVFCSYGSVPCPSKQEDSAAALSAEEQPRRHRPRFCNG